MAGTQNRTVVLLPIKPQYAEPIMDGRKRVEFRKTVFARTPTHVVVYASSPVKKVLGYFEVEGIDIDTVEALWVKHGDIGGIAEVDYRDYYAGREYGIALAVERVIALADPITLKALGVLGGPPQSFMYLDGTVLGGLQAGSQAPDLHRLPRRRARLLGRSQARRSAWAGASELPVPI